LIIGDGRDAAAGEDKKQFAAAGVASRVVRARARLWQR
jgi:hypothetical protein